jgi:hypothetical protein
MSDLEVLSSRTVNSSSTPEMLKLIELSAERIERILSQDPGGGGRCRTSIRRRRCRKESFFHHLTAQLGDLYLLSGLIALPIPRCENSQRPL